MSHHANYMILVLHQVSNFQSPKESTLQNLEPPEAHDNLLGVLILLTPNSENELLITGVSRVNANLKLLIRGPNF